MKESYKNNKAWITALLYVLVGVLFIVFKAEMLNILLTVVGALFIIQGIFSVANKDSVSGVFNIVIGLVILLGGWLFLDIVLLVFGILLAVKGAIDLLASLSSKNFRTIATAGVTLLVGVLLILAKWVLCSILDIILIILGVLFIIDGITALLGLNSKGKGKKK